MAGEGQVLRLAEGWAWPHGSKTVRAEPRHRGPGHMWLRAWPDPDPDDVLFGFEDHVRVRSRALRRDLKGSRPRQVTCPAP